MRNSEETDKGILVEAETIEKILKELDPSPNNCMSEGLLNNKIALWRITILFVLPGLANLYLQYHQPPSASRKIADSQMLNK